MRGKQDRPGIGIEVPGALLSLDPYRGKGPILFWVKNLGLGLLTLGYSAFSSFGMPQDVVVQDPTGLRNLYREGPFSRIKSQYVMKRLANEISQVGIDEFLRGRRIENSQIGPIDAPSGNIGIFKSTLVYVDGFVHSLIRRLRHTK